MLLTCIAHDKQKVHTDYKLYNYTCLRHDTVTFVEKFTFFSSTHTPCAFQYVESPQISKGVNYCAFSFPALISHVLHTLISRSRPLTGGSTGGGGGHVPPFGGREVPQLIEGSETNGSAPRSLVELG